MSLVLLIAFPILGAFLLPMLAHRSAVLGRFMGPVVIAVNAAGSAKTCSPESSMARNSSGKRRS